MGKEVGRKNEGGARSLNDWILFSIGFMGLILIIFFMALLIVPKFPDEINLISGDKCDLKRTLSTTGTFEKLVSPDQVEIILSIETLKETAKLSQEENSIISTQVRSSLKNVGVKDSQIETIQYLVNEQFEWESNWQKQVSKGFKTTHSIKITLNDLTKTGDIIDAVINAGANKVSSVNFTLSKESQEREKQLALTSAAKTAKSKAQSMVEGLGVELGKIDSINENSYYYTPSYRNTANIDMKLGVMEESVSTFIDPSNVLISATVSVVYEIK